jgi:hypothetical protein
MIGNQNQTRPKTNKSMTRLIPKEFLEPNWRLWSFILLLVVGIFLMINYPVAVKYGLTDPFYSPTVAVLPFVGLFRLTCYAYRKDYHRHVFNHPRTCEIGFRAEFKGREYTGETRFFRLENLHRYFVYFAVAILPFFYYDIFVSLTYQGGVTLTLGGILLIVNTAFVTLYTFSCHAIRHLIGGSVDCFSCKHNVRKKLFFGQTKLNIHHETYAWLSLTMFFLVDLFIRATVAGVIPNIVLLH